MIFVDVIKYREVHGTSHEQFTYNPHRFDDNYVTIDQDGVSRVDHGLVLEKEVAKCRHFINPQTGEDILVAFSECSSNVLGLSYEVYEKQAEQIEGLQNRMEDLKSIIQGSEDHIVILEKELNENFFDYTRVVRCVRRATLWERFKYLFTGNLDGVS